MPEPAPVRLVGENRRDLGEPKTKTRSKKSSSGLTRCSRSSCWSITGKERDATTPRSVPNYDAGTPARSCVLTVEGIRM
jgi:hypothetical protein